MKKFLIYVLFFMFFSANAVLAVTYSSRPAMPATEEAAYKLNLAMNSSDIPFCPQNPTKSQAIEWFIKWSNNIFATAGYDYQKTIDKMIHQYNINPELSAYNELFMSLLVWDSPLYKNYTKNEEQVLKKYFSQETVNFFNKNYETKSKNKQTFVVVQEQNEITPYSFIEKKVQKPTTKNPPTTTYSKNDSQSPYNQTDAQTQVVSQKTDSNEWNIWRSNIQNEIMAKAKIKAPTGTMFMFTFNVDKYGRISYLKIWAKPETYSPLSQDVLSPIILGLQGTSILSFPANSQREATNVNGGFTMSDTTKYSSPTDYNDKENKTVTNPIQNNIQNNYNPYNNVIQQSNYQNTYNQNNTNRNNNNSNKNYSNVINDAMGIVRDVNSIIRTWK